MNVDLIDLELIGKVGLKLVRDGLGLLDELLGIGHDFAGQMLDVLRQFFHARQMLSDGIVKGSRLPDSVPTVVDDVAVVRGASTVPGQNL